jgi:hypothetical protein
MHLSAGYATSAPWHFFSVHCLPFASNPNVAPVAVPETGYVGAVPETGYVGTARGKCPFGVDVSHATGSQSPERTPNQPYISHLELVRILRWGGADVTGYDVRGAGS